MGNQRKGLKRKGVTVANDKCGYARKAVKNNKWQIASKRPTCSSLGHGLFYQEGDDQIEVVGWSVTGAVENVAGLHVFQDKSRLTHQSLSDGDDRNEMSGCPRFNTALGRIIARTPQNGDGSPPPPGGECDTWNRNHPPGRGGGRSRGDQHVSESLSRARTLHDLSPSSPICATESGVNEEDTSDRSIIGSALRKEIPKMLETGKLNRLERRHLMDLLTAELRRYHGLGDDDELTVIPQTTVSDALVAAEIDDIGSTLEAMRKSELRAFVLHCLSGPMKHDIMKMVPARASKARLFNILFGKDETWWQLCSGGLAPAKEVMHRVVIFWIDPTQADLDFAKHQHWYRGFEDQTKVWRRRHFGDDDDRRRTSIEDAMWPVFWRRRRSIGTRKRSELVPQGYHGAVIAAFSVRIGATEVGGPVSRRCDHGQPSRLSEGRGDGDEEWGNHIVERRSDHLHGARLGTAPYSLDVCDAAITDRISLIQLKPNQSIADLQDALMSLLAPANLAVGRSKKNPAVWVIVPGRVREVGRKPWVWSRTGPWADALQRKLLG